MRVTATPALVINWSHFGLGLHPANSPSHSLSPPSQTNTAMSIRRAVAPRSVHVRFRPKPLNLSESREIFRVLQRFGEISSFYYLKVGAPR